MRRIFRGLFCSSILLVVMVFSFERLGQGQGTCTNCMSDVPPLGGHGAAGVDPEISGANPTSYTGTAPAGDPRRVVTISINSGWDSSPGVTNSTIWNAVVCAATMWNNARDASGNTNGYFLKLSPSTQNAQQGDILVVNTVQDPSDPSSPLSRSQITPFPSSTNPAWWKLELDPTNVNFDAQTLCGRLGHEIGHALGLANSPTNAGSPTCASIMVTSAPYSGARSPLADKVTPQDVSLVEQNLNPSTRSGCQSTFLTAGGADGCDPSVDPQCAQPNGCSGAEPTCPNGQAFCDSNTAQWVCPGNGCSGTPPQCSNGQSAVCNAIAQWECQTGCQLPAPDCAGTLTCVNGQWGCVSSVMCGTAPPPCTGDLTCVDGAWSCVTSCDVCDPSCADYDPSAQGCSNCTDVCDPSCTDYNPSDPSCGGCDPTVDPSCGGGCSDPCDPTCPNYDPSDPSCSGGGGGGGCTDCCMSVSPCDVGCYTVSPAQRKFWNTTSASLLPLRPALDEPMRRTLAQAGRRPLVAVAGGSSSSSLARRKPDVVKIVERLKLPRVEAGGDLSPVVFQQILGGAPTRGNPEAPVTIVEFSDFQCPYCKAMAATLARQVLPTEGGTVRLVYKYFPLTFHSWAEEAAEISACVHQQDEEAFWQLHDFFFEQQRSLHRETLEQDTLAFLKDNHRINAGQLKSCIETHATKSLVARDMAQGRQQGVHGTPTLFVNGIRVSGARDAISLRQVIEQARAEVKPLDNARVREPAQPDLVPPGTTVSEICERLGNEGRTPCLF